MGIGMKKITDEFWREAVRIALNSDRTIGQVASDLGIGKSTLGILRKATCYPPTLPLQRASQGFAEGRDHDRHRYPQRTLH